MNLPKLDIWALGLASWYTRWSKTYYLANWIEWICAFPKYSSLDNDCILNNLLLVPTTLKRHSFCLRPVEFGVTIDIVERRHKYPLKIGVDKMNPGWHVGECGIRIGQSGKGAEYEMRCLDLFRLSFKDLQPLRSEEGRWTFSSLKSWLENLEDNGRGRPYVQSGEINRDNNRYDEDRKTLLGREQINHHFSENSCTLDVL